MKIENVRWKDLTRAQQLELLKRPVNQSDGDFSKKVEMIIAEVRQSGDAALIALTEKLDRVALTQVRVTESERAAALTQVDPELMKAIRDAIRRITVFHEAQLPCPIDLETSAGVRCERKFFPIERVGLYIPGGTAPLPSTVMMLGVPSRIAGCSLRVLATPPQADGSINSTILATAHELGITEIYKMGGAQAIAALAYGTQSVPKVDKIYGPGNAWVTEAKLQVSQDPSGAACDLPAGPSEVLVIADHDANPGFVASDLLSQAEHGVDSQVILISTSAPVLKQVQVELAAQLAHLPRSKIAALALEKSVLIEVETLKQAMDISNEYAPEHLILQVQQAREYSKGVRHAGSVFLGAWTPESVGDYASGTNHVLPTYGFARSYSGLSTESFMKAISFQELSEHGLRDLGPTVERIAEAEFLDAHKRAVSIRLKGLQ